MEFIKQLKDLLFGHNEPVVEKQEPVNKVKKDFYQKNKKNTAIATSRAHDKLKKVKIDKKKFTKTKIGDSEVFVNNDILKNETKTTIVDKLEKATKPKRVKKPKMRLDSPPERLYTNEEWNTTFLTDKKGK